jgi:hypothetical protein
VDLPEEKELNFLGFAFPRASYYPGNEAFIFKYLSKFPQSHTTIDEARRGRTSVSGEASPDYFVGGMHTVVNTLRFAPRARVIVSLRDPTDRAVSAYHNKFSDGTVHKMLNPTMFGAVKADQRHDSEVEGFRAPTFHQLVRRANDTAAVCPKELHFTMNDDIPAPGSCLVQRSDGKAEFLPAAEADKKLRKHFKRLLSSQGDQFCRAACYVNPFVHHGAYVK